MNFTKKVIFLFIFSYSIASAGKSGPLLGPSSLTEISVSITSTEAKNEIKNLIDEINNKSRLILNGSCSSITYTEAASYLKILVDSENYYILLTDQILNSINYYESQCMNNNTTNPYEITCTARAQDVQNSDQSLSLTIKYGKVGTENVIYGCHF